MRLRYKGVAVFAFHVFASFLICEFGGIAGQGVDQPDP